MFSSKRLRYRKLNRGDFNFFYLLFSDQQVMKYTYLDAFHSIIRAKEEFEKVITMQEDEAQGTLYIAELKDTFKEVGIVDYEVLIKNAFGGIYEIGYFLLPQYWGMGYAGEMGEALIHFIFANEAVHKIVASCHRDNRGSEEIMKKLGMKKEGLFKLARYKNGTWVDEIRYGLLREDYMTTVKERRCTLSEAT